jgi:hypothetical protein
MNIFNPITRAGGVNFGRLFVAIFGCLSVGGCVYQTAFPEKNLPDKTSAIVPGQMTGGGVSNRLGNPLITSRYWGVELYRDASSQSEYPMAIVIPAGRATDKIYRYTLIAYDANGVVTSKATGIHRRPSSFRTATPISYDHLTTQIQAGDFTFVNDWVDRQETLLVNPARRDAYLERIRNPARCTVVIGCGTGESSDQLKVNGGPALPIPCRLRVQNFDQAAIDLYRQGKMAEYEKNYPIVNYDTLAVLSLAPGSHRLKAWGGRWEYEGKKWGRFSGEKSVQFYCEAGETLYIVIDVSMKGYEKDWFWGWIPVGVEWKINQHKEMPPFFANRPLLLYRSDQWFVSPELGE